MIIIKYQPPRNQTKPPILGNVTKQKIMWVKKNKGYSKVMNKNFIKAVTYQAQTSSNVPELLGSLKAGPRQV